MFVTYACVFTNLLSFSMLQQTDVPFPKNFESICKKILTRLYRVFVHSYVHHFDIIVRLNAEAHVNTCYKHFVAFVREFSLVSEKEFEPLAELTRKLCNPNEQFVSYRLLASD